MRIAASLIALAATAATAATGDAVAESRHDSSAPIDFAADHIELQDQQNRAILSGNVRITQAEMVLTAARVTVAYTGKVTSGSPQASRIDASGGVTVTRPDQRARGQYGVYDVNRRVIIMLGGVTLNQGANTVSGSRLTINLDTGKAVIDGSGSVSSGNGPSTTTGGRVTGRFSVPKRNQ
jgi:lipopolysaccharide export system protein LptA